jgi:RNA polymerase sigma factor (sigma-70 family)
MTKGEQSFLQHIQTIFESGTIGELSDGQLLERFAGRDPEAAELCFAALIKRHGPMVFRTCQVILRDRHEAEDAFQATFLVLARKARSLWIRDSLGPWLFEVSCRVACCARSAALRRRFHERKAASMGPSATHQTSSEDGGAVVCEEVQRLPDRYRAAVVLCDLEGLTQERAAQVLGWPAGTVRSRLARGRQRLRDRLTRRGLAPAVAPGPAWLTGEAPSAAVPGTVAESTTHAALRLIRDRAVVGAVASAGSLAEGVIRAMFWSKLKVIAAAMLAGGLFAGTALLAYWSAALQPGRSGAPQSEAPAKDNAGGIPRPIVSSPPSPQAYREATSKKVSTAPAPAGAISLSPNAKARLDVAKKLRDGMHQWSQIDPNRGFSEVLASQNRYDEVVAELLVKTDADRVRFLEHRLDTLKRMEHFVRDCFKSARLGLPEVLAVELCRLEAEDRLEKAMAKAGASGAGPADTGSSQLMQFLSQDSWDPNSRPSGRPPTREPRP